MIHDENNVSMDHELVIARGQLKKIKYAYLNIQNQHPHESCVK